MKFDFSLLVLSNMIHLSYGIILIAFTIAVKASSSDSSRCISKSCNETEEGGCTLPLMKYSGRFIFLCRKTDKKNHKAIQGPTNLHRNMHFGMLCHQLKLHFDGHCMSSDGCDSKVVCIHYEDKNAYGKEFHTFDAKTITEDHYKDVMSWSKRINYYEIMRSKYDESLDIRVEHPGYYASIECEHCEELRKCSIQKLGMGVHGPSYRSFLEHRTNFLVITGKCLYVL